MNLETVLGEIAGLVKSGRLRFRLKYAAWDDYSIRDERNLCPLCALAEEKGLGNDDSLNFLGAANRMGLPKAEANLVADAADFRGKQLRGRLLQACGLEEFK